MYLTALPKLLLPLFTLGPQSSPFFLNPNKVIFKFPVKSYLFY